jgi:hypothetical protein
MSQVSAFEVPLTTIPPLSPEILDRLDHRDEATGRFQTWLQEHVAIIEKNTTPPRSAAKSSESLDLLIRWMATSSISFRAIQSPPFLRFCMSLNEAFSIPGSEVFSRKVSEIAESLTTIPAHVTPTFCSLMLDGATKFGHQFLAVMLFLESQVHFLELLDLPDQ